MKCVGVARALVVLLALGLVPQAADAQEVASVSGVVRDTGGGALPGATVQLDGLKGGGRRFTQTDAQGRYAFAGVAPGAYRMTASISAFNPSKGDVTLSAGQKATKDFSLDFAYFANVTVTPQKREEQLLDVPASISAVPADVVEKQAVTSLTEIKSTIPGLSTVESGTGASRVQLRGISSPQNLPTVGVYLDEASINVDSAGSAHDVRLLDLERVEVLRGPQGTLYGEGSMGGTIKYVTKDPNLEALGLEFDSAAGTTTDGTASGRASLVANVPLAEGKLALRVLGAFEHAPGWVNYPAVTDGEDINSGDAKTFRAKLLWVPTETISVSLLYQKQKNDFDGPNFADPDRTAPFVIAQPYEQDSNVANLVFNWDLGSVTLLSSTGYLDNSGSSRNDFTSIFGPIFDLFGFPPGTVQSVARDAGSDAKQWNQEVRLASKGAGPFTWTAGGYYRNYDDTVFNRTTTTPNPIAPYEVLDLEQSQTSEQAALFGELGYAFSPKFSASLGLRGFRDKRTQEGWSASFGPPAPSPSHEETFTSFDPRFVVSVRPSEGLLLYASAAKGFRSGGFNNLPPGCSLPEAYDPETLWTYELGTTVSAAGGRVVTQGAVFHNQWSDIQSLTQCPGLPLVQTSNSGKATGTGIDLSIAIAATRDLRFTLSGNWNDSTYDTDSPSHVKGDQIDYVPRYTFGAAMDWTFRWAQDVPGLFHVDYQTTGDYTITLRNLGLQPLSSDVIGGLNARVAATIGKVELSLFGRNLLDEDGAIQPAIPPGGVPSAVRPQPRTIGAGFGFKL